MVDTSHQARADGLPRRTVLGYAASMIGLNALYTMIGVHLMFYCTDVVMVAPAIVGVVMLMAQLWDAVTDPLMGHLSDRIRWRWGRRRPFILLGALPTAAAFALLFSLPPHLSDCGRSIYFGATFLLFMTARTVWDTPYCALAPELTQDYDERTRISAWQQAFGTVGDVAGTIAPVLIVPLLALPQTGWAAVGCLVGILALGSALWTYGGTAEVHRESAAPTVRFFQSLRATFRNRAFRILVIATTCTGISNYMTIAVVRHVIRHWFHREALEAYFFGAFFVGVFVSIPLWSLVTRRLGKKRAYLIAMLAYSAILCSVLALRRSDTVLFASLMVLAGAFNISFWLIPGSMMPDVTDWDPSRGRERREGAYYGVWTLLRKTSLGAAYGLIGLVLAGVGYAPDAAQSASVLLWLRLLFGPVPAILLLVGAAVFVRFPITRAALEDMRRCRGAHGDHTGSV